MRDEKRKAQENIRRQREELSANLGDDAGVCQLEFSNSWYQALHDWNNRYTWQQKRREAEFIAARQGQGESKTSKPEEYNQASIFDQGEFKDV